MTEVDEGHKGGLDLGQIRDLTERLIHKPDCDKCGKIPVNFFSRDETQAGYVKINWRTNAVCQASENCIDPTDLAKDDNNDTGNGTTESTDNATTDKKDNGAAGATVMGRGYLGGLMILGATFVAVL